MWRAIWAPHVQVMTTQPGSPFEALLTDYYPTGGRVEKLLGERLRLAARGIRDLGRMTAAVEELYDARSKVVHQGRHDLKPDLFLARRAFTHALIGVASRLDRVQHAGTAHPIEDILR